MLARVFGALWPLLFVPMVIALIKSGRVGPYEHLAFEIGEHLAIATLLYAAFYIGLWIAGIEHAMSAIFSAVFMIVCILLYQTIFPQISTSL